MADQHRYKVIFLNQGQVYEVFARAVTQSDLFGFVEVEGLLFGERSRVVVDPGEESLKNEFSGVSRFMIPVHSVVRIDQVEKEGVSRIAGSSSEQGTVARFPTPLPDKPPGREPSKS